MLATARACVRKKREKQATVALDKRATRQRRSDIQGSNIFCPIRRQCSRSAFTANVYGKKAFIVAPSLQRSEDAGSILLRLGHRLLLARARERPPLQHARHLKHVSRTVLRADDVVGERGDADFVELRL